LRIAFARRNLQSRGRAFILRAGSFHALAYAIGAFALSGTSALAHTPSAAETTLVDVSVFALIAGLGLAYACGSWRLSRRSPLRSQRHARAALFWTGWALLAIALGPPLDGWSSRSFAAHMIQHEIMMLLAAPLLVMAKPFGVVLWGLPERAARALAGTAQARTTRWLARRLSSPLGAWLVHAIVLWGWHAPLAFEAALARPAVHWLQHTSFFVSALFFWWSVFAAGRLAERRGAAIVSVFTTGMHTSVLGALLTFSTRLWYPAYAPGFAAWNLTAIEDQQLGGLVMWVPGGIVFLIAGLALTGMWLKEAEKRMTAH
jgi:cytochrome c oxidase assembly factor CtaG